MEKKAECKFPRSYYMFFEDLILRKSSSSIGPKFVLLCPAGLTKIMPEEALLLTGEITYGHWLHCGKHSVLYYMRVSISKTQGYRKLIVTATHFQITDRVEDKTNAQLNLK